MEFDFDVSKNGKIKRNLTKLWLDFKTYLGRHLTIALRYFVAFSLNLVFLLLVYIEIEVKSLRHFAKFL